jgi:putative ABC transport system permease protein
VRLGLKSLWLHRLRSLLTMLGIVFGVCSVIAMLAIGEGASFEAQEQIKNLGSQNIILSSIKPPEEQKIMDRGSQSFLLQYGLTYADLRRIQYTIPGVTIIVPGRLMREYVSNINRRVDCEILGTVPWYPEMRNQHVAQGRFFTDHEMESKANVCVLSAEVVPGLFPLDSPLGRDVRIGGTYYRVIGIMEPRAKGPAPAETDTAGRGVSLNRIFIPLETAKTRYGEILARERQGSFEAEKVALHEVTVQVDSQERVVPVAEAIKTVMQRNHKKEDYKLLVPLELLKKAEATKHIFNVVLGSIAAISLLVGGIGIMNIMLVTVRERTREIGVWKAVGATDSDVLIYYLAESVLTCLLGGVLGIFLGIFLGFQATGLIANRVVEISGWVAIFKIQFILLAFGTSALVGLFSGLFPAYVAARLEPSEALRHE